MDGVRVIAIGRTQGCRFVAQVEGVSSYPTDPDLYLAAVTRARAKAAAQSANAIAIRAYRVQSGAKAETSGTITADIYNCAAFDDR